MQRTCDSKLRLHEFADGATAHQLRIIIFRGSQFRVVSFPLHVFGFDNRDVRVVVQHARRSLGHLTGQLDVAATLALYRGRGGRRRDRSSAGPDFL